MARHSGLWRRKRDGWWMTTLNGKQVKLARDKAEARKALHELLARPDAPPATCRLSFRKLADLFLGHCERTMAANTFRTRRSFLRSFCDHVGRVAVSDLRVKHVSAWEAAHPNWSRSTVSAVRGVLLACLNWAVREGHVAANPLARLKVEGFARRNRVLSADERARLKGAATPYLRDFLTALELTGARPYSELARLTASMVDWAGGVIRFAEHKNAKRNKTRTVYLTPPLAELLRRKAAEHPTGPLFRTRKGGPWTPDGMSERMKVLAARLGIPALTAMTLRHTFTTDALARGLTADVVAELVGNSARTVAAHYAHLDQRTAAMQAAALKALS